MAQRDIITVPDPRLKQVSHPVDAVTDDIRALMDDMLETMYAAPGIGLAAVQVGVLKRVVVVDVAKDQDEDDRSPLYFINPEVTWVSEETALYEEGCLSIPEIYEEIERPAACKVTFIDSDGTPAEMQCEGLLATVIQHEIDHTNGILFVDHLSRLKRERTLRKFAKQNKQPA